MAKKVSSRFTTQDGPMGRPSGSGSGQALTAREIAEYRRKAKAKKKKKKDE